LLNVNVTVVKIIIGIVFSKQPFKKLCGRLLCSITFKHSHTLWT